MAFEEFLSRIKDLRRCGSYWIGKCPAHDDQRPSLSVRINRDKLLLRCHTGCSFEAILRGLNMTATDCFLEQKPLTMGREVASYNYQDEAGKTMYQVVRFEPKDFRIRSPEGTGWKWGMNGQRRIIYRLDRIFSEPSRVLIVVEGEKAVDRLEQEGFLATCSPGGAGKWLPEYADQIGQRKQVVIIPDNDIPGREHAMKVKQSLLSSVKTVRVLSIPGLPEKGDVVDFFENGGDADHLRRMCLARLNATVLAAMSISLFLNPHERWELARQLLAQLEAQPK